MADLMRLGLIVAIYAALFALRWWAKRRWTSQDDEELEEYLGAHRS